jgi:vesicle-associated membrane protein 7
MARAKSDGTFIYAMIAFQHTPVAEFSPVAGNCRDFATAMLEQIDPTQSFAQSECGQYVFYALVEKTGLVFLSLSVADASVFLRRNMLEEMKSKWHAKFGNTAEQMTAYQKSSDFESDFKAVFATFSTERAKKLAEVKDNIQKTQDQTTQNLTLALARGEQLEVMAAKADKILESASAFHREAKSVSRMMWCQKWRWYFIGAGIVVVIVFIIVLIACGGNFKKC